MHWGPAHTDAALLIAGIPTVYTWKSSTILDGMPAEYATGEAYGVLPMSLVPPESIKVETPDVGGVVRYGDVPIILTSAGPADARGPDAPDRLFGRRDGGGWQALLMETLQADAGIGDTFPVSSELTGNFPQVVHLSQEAILISACTSSGAGLWDLTIAERAVADTAVQEHVYDEGDQLYATRSPTAWQNRPASLWLQRTDPSGNRIGTAVEVFVGEIETRDGRIEVDVSGVTFLLKPLTGVLQRSLGKNEPEVIELARYKHRYDRLARCQIQIGQEFPADPGAAPPQLALRRLVTGSVFVAADDPDERFLTVGWPAATISRINANLELDRGVAPIPDQDLTDACVKVTLSVDRVSIELRTASVRNVCSKVIFASDHGGGWDIGAPAAGDLNMRMGVDVLGHLGANQRMSADGTPTLDEPWEWSRPRNGDRAINSTAADYDGQGDLMPWPVEGYYHAGEAGLLTTAGVASTPQQMVLEYYDPAGELRAVPWTCTASEDLGDGTFWLTIDPFTPIPSFGQRDDSTRARIFRASYADRLPFWRFMVEALNSGTAREALGEYDLHVNGAGIPIRRLAVDTFDGLRLPAAWGSVTGAAMFRDPAKLMSDTMKLAVAAFGLQQGLNGERAQLAVYRRNAARPDLTRQSIDGTILGGAAPRLSISNTGVNQLSVKVAGFEKPIVIFSKRGQNDANYQTYHLGANRDPTKADIDLSAVDMGDIGTTAAALIPVSARMFQRTTSPTLRFELEVDPAQVDMVTLRPFDTFGLSSDLIQRDDGRWIAEDLLAQAVAWTIPIRGSLGSLTVEASPGTATGWNAAANITGEAGTTLTLSKTEYVDAVSPRDGSPQNALDLFEADDVVFIYPIGNVASGVERTLVSKDRTAGTVVINAALPVIANAAWGVMRPASYANMSALHRSLAVLGDASGEASPGVVAAILA